MARGKQHEKPFVNCWQTDDLFIGDDRIRLLLHSTMCWHGLESRWTLFEERCNRVGLCLFLVRLYVSLRMPHSISSDKGPGFANQTIEGFLSLLIPQSARQRWQVSRPQGLSIVEQNNQDVLALLDLKSLTTSLFGRNGHYLPFVSREPSDCSATETQFRPIIFLGDAIMLDLFERLPNEDNHPSIAEIVLAAKYLIFERQRTLSDSLSSQRPRPSLRLVRWC